ncbi:MAG: hypothetical protein HUK20_03875 [Fibrobacter sp.]|nr:hypothetical protein [Fibrobacter sp.]
MRHWIFTLVSIFVFGFVSCSNNPQLRGEDSILKAKYAVSIKDAAEASEDEVHRLLTIRSQSDDVSWNIQKDKVLMVTMHRDSSDFKAGEMTLSRELWVVADREILKWYRANQEDVKDWTMRFKQLLGLPPERQYGYFTAAWVYPKDMMRPAYSTDIQTSEMRISFEEETEIDLDESKKWFRDWFEKNRAKSYLENGYPWTRLGYTYDWAYAGTNKDKYGLTEFLVLPNSEVEILFTKDVKSFLKWMNDKNP